MIFDIGCCCTIPTGGIYDFWAVGGYALDFGDVGREKSTIVSRMPSRQSFIYDYLGSNGNSTARQRLESNDGVRDDVHITSFYIGDYMDLWVSGEMLEDTYSNNPVFYNQPKSMNIVGKERLWISSLVSSSGNTYDYFQHSGISYDVNRTIGSGAEITGNYLRCITGDVSSGVYVKWTFPDNFIPLWDTSLTIENSFDKVILFTMNHPSGGAFGTKTELWFGPSLTYNSNAYITYVGGSPSSSGRINFQPFAYSLYNDENISSNELLHISLFNNVEGFYLKDLEIRLVDSVSGYTLDDVSGYSSLLYDLRMPYLITGGVTSYLSNYLDNGNIRLSLVDPTTKSILYNRTMRYADSYWADLTGIDYYKYGSYASLTGVPTFDNAYLWSWVGAFHEKTRRNPYVLTTCYSDLFSGHTGSIIVQRQVRNSLFSSNHTDNTVAFTSDGSGILVADAREYFDEDSFTNPTPILVLEYKAFNDYDIFTYYGINTSVVTTANTEPILSNLSAAVFDCVQRSSLFYNNDYFPEIVAMIDANDDTETLLYGSTHHFTVAEYNIPSDEKIAYYQKFLRRYHYPSGYRGDWYPLNIDNFNNGPTLPKIGHICTRDAPKAFCVDLPRMNFITGTGAPFVTRGPSGMLNQTTRILYGDITQSTFTTSMLSGQWLGGGITGGISDGGGGSTINYLRNFDFTGYNGQARPYTTFSYDGFSDESLSGLTSKTGRIYDFEFSLLHGDENGEVFWEDSLEQNVRYYKYHYDFGVIGGTEYPIDADLIYSGLYRSPAIPNISVNVLHGSKHLASNTLGASFVHSYNHYILGNSQDSISGEAYVKLKIGDNIVYNERLYYNPNQWGYNNIYSYPVIGPFALHATNDEQLQLMTGNYAAFVWFEQLYQTPPRPVIADTFNNQMSGAGIVTGWKMHVTNQTGGDIFSVSISGLEDDIINYSLIPYVQDSSDSFFYVTDFLMPYTGVADGGYATHMQSFLDATGGTRNPRYVFAYALWDISGAVRTFGMSHDCKAFIPGGNEFDTTVFAGSSGQIIPSTPFTSWRNGYSIINTCVKNTSLMAETPKRSDWLVGTGFPYTTKYYTITGVWMYDTPTGQAPIFPLDDTFTRFQRTLFSTTGFDLSSYTDYQYATSGLPYLKVLPVSSNIGPFLYLASGTTQSGWL